MAQSPGPQSVGYSPKNRPTVSFLFSVQTENIMFFPIPPSQSGGVGKQLSNTPMHQPSSQLQPRTQTERSKPPAFLVVPGGAFTPAFAFALVGSKLAVVPQSFPMTELNRSATLFYNWPTFFPGSFPLHDVVTCFSYNPCGNLAKLPKNEGLP